MNRSSSFWHLSRVIPLTLGGLLLFALVLTSGCGSKGKDGGPGAPADRASGTGTGSSRASRPDRPPADRGSPRKTPEEQRFEAAQKKEMEVTAQLEQADKMVKGANLEGALRVVQRVEQENALDPAVTMRTAYLQAMIYHRLKDGPKRKEAMNRLLKDMEKLQGDPRFQQGFIDGMASQEVIKMSLEKAGKNYGN